MLWQFLVLLAVHWFSDFVLQTHWQASNKSKNNSALLRHVLVYTICIGAASFAIFTPWVNLTGLSWFGFVWSNFALHFATDFVSSRISSPLFLSQFDKFDLVMPPPVTGTFGIQTESRLLMKKNFNPHNFFVMIGFDQLVHQVTLAGTMVLFFGAR